MKILTGKFKGRVIKMPQSIRPTQQKVRKAIFDVLFERIEGADFLELFAGSGAVGIEALSAGAASVDFVECDSRNLELIRKNLESLKTNSFNTFARDAASAVEFLHRHNKMYDIIFLDPPYFKDLAKNCLLTIDTYDILNPVGFVVVQHHKKDAMPDSLRNLTLYKTYSYSDNRLTFYRKE